MLMSVLLMSEAVRQSEPGEATTVGYMSRRQLQSSSILIELSYPNSRKLPVIIFK